MTDKKNFRLLAIDTSGSPGFAVVEVRSRGKRKGEPLLLHVDSETTDAGMSDALRYSVIEAKTVNVCHAHGPFDIIVREHFTKGGSKRGTQIVFGSWAAVDSGLLRFGYAISDKDEITPSTVKATVGGRGGASKEEVEEGCRKYFNLPEDFVFRNDNESDAAAIAYTWLLQRGYIDEWHKARTKNA